MAHVRRAKEHPRVVGQREGEGGEYVYGRFALEHLGVPFQKIRILNEPMRNTADELEAVARQM
jgi:hypothetical protein